MQKTLLLLTAVAISTGATAQTLVGAKLGLNYTMISTSIDPEPDEEPDRGSGLGFHIGGYAQFELTERVGLRPELLLSFRGLQEDNVSRSTSDVLGVTTVEETRTSDKALYNYLEVPVLIAFQPSENLGFQVGPGFGFLMGGKLSSSGSTTTTVTVGNSSTTTTSDYDEEFSGSDVTDPMRGLEIGAVVGMIYETDGGFNLGLRYWRGLNTVNEDTEYEGVTVKNYSNLLQFSIGYSFIKA